MAGRDFEAKSLLMTHASEQVGATLHVASDRQCRPSGDRLDVACHPVVAVFCVQPSHGDEMLEYMLWQTAAAKLLVTPVIERHIDICDRSTYRCGVLGRHASHV